MDKKRLSKEHEDHVAYVYGGTVSRSSGASDTDKGDVRTKTALYECKMTGEPGGKSKRTTLIRNFEKIADEAWAEGREPAVSLRVYCPESVLSDIRGWVNMTVRLESDDVSREWKLAD